MNPRTLTEFSQTCIYRGAAPDNQVSTIRKVLFTGIRLFITVGLLWALMARMDLSRALEIISHASIPLLAATLVVLLAGTPLVALRWNIILSAEAPSPGTCTLLKIVLVGMFFNQVLPTGVGGDAVRAWRCRKVGISLGTAIRSILLDRACGYAVLVALYAASLPDLLCILPDARQRNVVIAVLAVAVSGLLGLLLLDQLPRPLLRHRLVAPLAELSRASRHLFTRPGSCGAVFCLSAGAIALGILAFKFVGDGVGSHLSLASWVMIMPPVTLIQLLPVSLAGWGVREVVLVVVLSSFGVPAEAALATSVLVGLCLAAVGLPGGLIWLADWDIARPSDPAGAQFGGRAG
jgi:glycosyltransferase 2 family protein